MKRLLIAAALTVSITSCHRAEEKPSASLLTFDAGSADKIVGPSFKVRTFKPSWVTIRPEGPALTFYCEPGEPVRIWLTASIEPPKPPPLRGVFATFKGNALDWRAEVSWGPTRYWFVGRDEDVEKQAAVAKALAAGPVIMTAETGWGLGDTLEWRLPDTPLAADFRRQCAGA